SGGRIIRQLLTESLLLALLGGTVGIALAMLAIRGMDRVIPRDLLAGAPIALNGPVLLFAAGVILLSAFVFGRAPAMQSAKPDVQLELKGSRTAVEQGRLRSVLAIAEISLSVILLAGACLMIKSLYRLLSVNPGFRTDRLLTMELDLRT